MSAAPSLESLRQWVSRLPIRRKLLLEGNLIAVVAALVVATVVACYRLVALRDSNLADTLAITHIVAENSAGPVAFQDSAAATTVLASLRAKPSVVGAVIDLPGKPDFAKYGVFPPSAGRLSEHTAHQFHGWTLFTAAPVGDLESRGATLQLISDLRPELRATLRAFALAIAAALALALAISHFASGRLRHSILNPIEALHAATQQVGSAADYGHRAPVLSQDELGELTRAFNGMLDRLQAADSELRTTNQSLSKEITERLRLEQALIDTSRQAGMAEVATGILHNVGNVLNSVNISTQLMREKLQRSQMSRLSRTAEIVKAQGDRLPRFIEEDPKGRLLPDFIVKISEALAGEHAAMATELGELAKNIDHIKEIVAAQQSLAKMAAVIETMSAEDLFSESLRVSQASLSRHGIEIESRFLPGITVTADRNQILQILVNFITNAVHAVKPNAPDQRHIVLGVVRVNDRVLFTVADNGVGIAAENLNRIFNHGFTTRRDGHGFGLHSGALAARVLGGAVRVESAGPGRGASFTLEIPASINAPGGPPLLV
jgi:signal transduction histidine kinase